MVFELRIFVNVQRKSGRSNLYELLDRVELQYSLDRVELQYSSLLMTLNSPEINLRKLRYNIITSDEHDEITITQNITTLIIIPLRADF